MVKTNYFQNKLQRLISHKKLYVWNIYKSQYPQKPLECPYCIDAIAPLYSEYDSDACRKQLKEEEEGQRWTWNEGQSTPRAQMFVRTKIAEVQFNRKQSDNQKVSNLLSQRFTIVCSVKSLFSFRCTTLWQYSMCILCE